MKLSAVLLAGGKSRRMGEDKAVMIVGDKPLWRTQVELLRNLQPEELFVSAQVDPAWRPSDLQFVADEPPSRGPLSGLCATMARMRGSHLLALAIDMPLMSERFLRSLYRHIQIGCGIVPTIGKQPEPLAAIYPIEAQPEMLAALSGSDFSLQRIVEKLVSAGRLKLLVVRKAEEIFFHNLNEPRDVGRISLMSHRSRAG